MQGNLFSTRKICPNCRSIGEMSEKHFKGNGKIISYSTVFAAPTGYKMRVPYILALVKLEEGPTVLGMLDDAKESEVKIGANVEKIFRKWGEGKSSSIIHYGFAFRLV